MSLNPNATLNYTLAGAGGNSSFLNVACGSVALPASGVTLNVADGGAPRGIGYYPLVRYDSLTGTLSLKLGGQEIKLISMLKNGSGDDSVVYLPAAKVLFLGELFQNSYFPTLNQGTSMIGLTPCDASRDGTSMSMSPAMASRAGKKEVAQFREFLEWFDNGVETRLREEKPIVVVKHEVGPLLENYKWHAPEVFPEEFEDLLKQLGKAPSKGTAPNRS